MFDLMEWSKALKQNQKGFTLVELMVVVVIIGILVAIAIPIYGGIQERAAQNAHDANARTLQGAASIWYAEDPGTAGGASVTTADMGDLATYVNEPYPEIPEIIQGEGSIGAEEEIYTINIDNDGSVTVTPGIGAYDVE